MKRIILPLFLLVHGVLYSQYSTYYNINTNCNVSVNADINHNISGTVFEHKTITTIDYGALSLANAQKEKNRLEQQRFNDERQRQIALEISENPTKAYDYGNWITFSSKDKAWNKTKESKENLRKIKEYTGFSEFAISYVFPNSLFNYIGLTEFQNTSVDGVTTYINIHPPIYNINNEYVDFESNFDSIEIGKELDVRDDQNKLIKTFFHKKELNRATVFGLKGYRSTIVWEDKYEYCITDNYIYHSESLGNGYALSVKVRYYGNKSETDFEKLEGRRYYLKPLIEKIISTARAYDLKIAQ